MNATLARLVRCLATALVMVGLATPLFAQTDDLPGRVGRVADLNGTVYLSTEEHADEWIEALRNSTVTTGDNLWVSGDGRAEIDYGGGQFRLARDTNVHIARLDDRSLALFVAHGRVIVRVRVLDAGDVVQVDTPNTQLALTRPGLYRIDVSENRDHTGLVVRQGEATVAIASGLQQVLPGQSASVSGSDANHAEVRSGYAVDGFDTWSADRDRRYERSRSASYVSRQMIGYADLDDHGRWESSAEYGAIWYPTTVAAGWAPYRHGRWSWVGGFGWTWVDDAPWGYAPFHYGRWVHVGHRWGWCPGSYIARPAWAPALVGWYGGSGWTASVSLGAPVYGWVPLGWGEPYLPAWRHCSDRCWTRYNRPYAVAVNHAERRRAPPTRYVNWSAPGGVTAVAQATFTGRAPVHTNLVAVRRENLTQAPALAHAPVIAKPSPRTIPGTRPVVGAPEPASQIFRERIGRGSPVTAPVRVAVPPAAMPRQVTPAPAVAAPPAMQPHQQRTQQRPLPPTRAAPGTWGAPSTPAQDARVPAQLRAPPGQQGAIGNRAVQPRQPPAAVAPMPRSAPPAVAPTPAGPQAVFVQTPQPARPAPSAAPVPPQAVHPVPAQAAQPVPPQGVRSVPRNDRPAPRGRELDRPKPER